MTDNVEILKKALKAAGHDQALALADAILPNPPEAAPASVEAQPAAEVPQVGAPATAEQAAAVANAQGMPPQQPGQLTSDGLTALLGDEDALVAFLETPGGQAELDRVMDQESKGRRV